ncbi:hypothetical protein ANN_08955 [Periplaneta americana]|uniref:Uncharacterized protein n=1 Tax=Periplaneta americana TaxID=6978 RepID=A0ABQ8T416_PERAM|nr:hypothetical protein ANN_08955 [Periplaneta americana]
MAGLCEGGNEPSGSLKAICNRPLDDPGLQTGKKAVVTLGNLLVSNEVEVVTRWLRSVDLSRSSRFIYTTHATRALQGRDLSGEELIYGSHTYFFDYTRTWRASPDEASAQCQGHLQYNTNL